MEIRAINREVCFAIRKTQEELRACTNELVELETRATKSHAEVTKCEAEYDKNHTAETGAALEKAYDKHDIVMTQFDDAKEYTERLTEVLEALQTANEALKSIM